MMTYFKLIKDNTFIGVVTRRDFRKYQHKHNILLICNEEKGQYVQFNDKLYHDDWMVPVTTDKVKYETLKVINILKEEYDTLCSAIATDKETRIIPEENDIIMTTAEDNIEKKEDVTVEYVKDIKIKEMNKICNDTIIKGFDIALSDGQTHHFSLTLEDQMNILNLSYLINSGQTVIPYHADGESCKLYSASDIKKIITHSINFKNWNIAYFNSLKSYINSLDDIKSINEIKYGTDIPEKYENDIFKILYKIFLQ